MQQPGNLLTDNERQTLRNSIKIKYHQYRLRDPVLFPKFEYNTNRTNYESLRTSFEEEFYVVRGLDRTSPTIHIPSTNTLALLFTDDDYVPNKKILNTCRSYAEGPTAFPNRHQAITPASLDTSMPKKRNKLVVGGLMALGIVVLSALIKQFIFRPSPSGLVIERPTNHSSAQQEVIVEGKVANAETVWLVVHPESGDFYYTQPATKVQDNNWWISVVFIGGVQEAKGGHKFQIRAFVNPTIALSSGKILRSWPQAELATDAIEVVRD